MKYWTKEEDEALVNLTNQLSKRSDIAQEHNKVCGTGRTLGAINSRLKKLEQGEVTYYTGYEPATHWTEEENRNLFEHRHEPVEIPGRTPDAVKTQRSRILRWEPYFDEEFSKEIKEALGKKESEIEERVREAQEEAQEAMSRSADWVEKQVQERTAQLQLELAEARRLVNFQHIHTVNKVWDYNIQLRHQVKKLEEEKASLEKKVTGYSAALKLLGVTKDSWLELKSKIKL